MNVALFSMANSIGQVKQQASLSIMKKSLEQAEQSTEQLVKLMESADMAALQKLAEPHLGGNIDIKL